jgi:hypothetical protein
MGGNQGIIDKIRKLIRHERSARDMGSAAEAEAFAAKIHALLLQHKISMSEVAVEDEQAEPPRVGEEEIPIGGKPRYGSVRKEDSRLMNVIAKHHFCQAIIIGGTNLVILVGAEDDRAVVAEMFRFLNSTMKRLARLEEEKTKAARRSVRRFKPHFYLGFAGAIHRRYAKMREAADAGSTALIRADALVKSYVQENLKTEPVQPRKEKKSINKNGYFAGVAAGSQVSLGTNVLSSRQQKASVSKLITRGTHL